MRKLQLRSIVLAAMIVFAASEFAGAVEFKFTIPTIPSTPKIASVTNSQASAGNPNFTVYANIQGQVQKEVCCNGVCSHSCDPNCATVFAACGMTDFTGTTDPRVTPNPTCIPGSVDSSGGTSASICGGKTGNPKVYYYYNADPSTTNSVNMTYDPITGNFKAPIDISLYSGGDVVTYYIIASDNRGNVVSEVPDPAIAPCSAATSWDGGFDTPPIGNCSFMNSYEQCAKFKSGTPTCASDYSQNDPTGDTCSEITVPSNTSEVDIIGITAGFGKGFSELPTDNVVCSKIKLSANPPDIGASDSKIAAYLMVFFNPDIIDPNPNDIYMPNATAISYAPGVNGADPNLVKVLWNGECVTNPNTADPLGCKLITGGSNESKLKISAGNGFLTFIAKDSIPGGKTMVGSASKEVSALIITGIIQLDGGTPFALTDMTAGLAVVAKNHNVTISTIATAPAAPLVPSVQTCINGAGTSYTSGTCAQHTSQPASNKCRLTVNPSPDSADKYTIYKSTTNSASSATFLADITTNLTSQNTYDHTISTLDGKTYYYFFSATKNGLQTDQKDWSSSKCTIEDWVAPTNATITSCATPPGKSGSCACTWEQDTNSDPSIRGFRFLRGTTQLYDENNIVAAAGVTSYSKTDEDASLILGTPYSYTVKTTDAGGNVSSGTSSSCTPEDLEAPAKIDSMNTSLVQGNTVGAKIAWNGSAESDAGGYNIYKCNNANYGCDNFPHANWIQVNNDLITHTGTGQHTNTIADVRDGSLAESEWCFWVEACDNCSTTGTCPTTNVPNCSSFSTTKPYRQCMDIKIVVDPLAPATPSGLAAQTPPPAEGKKCKLTWSKVTTNSNAASFVDPNNPTSIELNTYYVMRAPLGETVPSNPNTAPAQNIAGTANLSSSPSFTDSGLTNGTTYQYLVIAYDGAQNFSSPQAQAVTCTPTDTTDPVDVSTVNVAKGEGDTSCDLTWSAISDPDNVTYSVNRCDKAAASCTKATTVDFPTAWGAELGLPITGITAPLELSDSTVDLSGSNVYTYCITAKDPSGNEPPIFSGANAGAASNCVSCQGGVVCAETEPPTGVTAAASGASGSNYGVKVKYTNSTSYDCSTSKGSHTVYICTGTSSSSCTSLKTGLTAIHSSTEVPGLTDIIASNSVTPATYYFGVAYKNGAGVDSTIVVASTPIVIDTKGGGGTTDPCDVTPVPAECNLTIKVGKITEKKVVACTKAADPTGCKSDAYKIVEAAPANASVKIIDTSTGLPVKTVTPATNGTVSDIMVGPGTPWYVAGRQYKVTVEVPYVDYGGLLGACSNSSTVQADGKCTITLKETTLNVTSTPTTVASDAKVLPKVRALVSEDPLTVFVGNGGDIGDVGGDGKVNISDLMDIKYAYGKTKASGSQCYKAWADTNLDGAVTVADLMVIKNYYNKTNIVPKAPGETITPTLLKTADPMPACCKTSPPTCQ